jgi:ribosomal protein S18 acetylase RimI-like enzyme
MLSRQERFGVRGLRLFVRPIEGSDHQEIRAFLDSQECLSSIPACGLLGKLLGDIVALVELNIDLQIESDAVRVTDIVVARELRRKWIGRVMMREVEQLAKKMDRVRLIVEDAGEAQEFFRRVGFEHEGERWVRVVP